jgi:O-antigen/teichoic acid export membrane protein
MNNAGKTIVKNASVLMGSQLVTWALTLLLTVFQPRYLGAAGVGELSVAIALWAIVGVLIAFGTDTLLIKEVARQPEQASNLLGTSLVMRTLFYLVGWSVVGLYLAWQQASMVTITTVGIIGLAQLLWTYIGACTSVMQGLEVMKYSSIAEIAGKFVNTILVIGLLLLGYGLVAVALTTGTAALIQLILLVRFLRTRVPLRLHFNPQHALAMARSGAPYLLSGLMLTIYSKVDRLIIAAIVDGTTVGWYSAAMTLFGTLMFVPTVMITALFPALSRSHTNDPSSLPRLVRKSFDFMLLVSVPVGFGLMIVSNQLVLLLFGSEFGPSGPVLGVLGAVLVCTYLTTLLGRFLTSTDKQNSWTVVMLVATIATIPLDLVFVPWCVSVFGNGALGGALSFAVTEFGMVVAGIVLMPRDALSRANAWTAARIIAAGLTMVAVTWWWRDAVLIVPVLIGATTYIGMVLLLRVVPAEDAVLLKEMAQRILGRFRRRGSKTADIRGV